MRVRTTASALVLAVFAGSVAAQTPAFFGPAPDLSSAAGPPKPLPTTAPAWSAGQPTLGHGPPRDLSARQLAPQLPSSPSSPAQPTPHNPTPPSSPAQMGITPTVMPEVLQVLDNTKTWVPIGEVAPDIHQFISITPVFDVRSIGMRSGGVDNSPLLSKLMSSLGPNGFNNGTADVLFSGINNQQIVPYYFSNSFIINRVARFRCGSGASAGGVELVFAAGVQGVVVEDGHFTSDGQYGGGSVDGCVIVSMGIGSGDITPNSPTITNVSMNSDLSGTIPPSVWNVGDGIMASPWNGYETARDAAIPAFAPGAYISAVSGSTLTLGGSYVGNSNLNPGSQGAELYQLPAALKYLVQTTAGSSTIVVISGPHPLVSGEVLWSDAFPLGSMVFSGDGSTFPQTLTIAPFSDSGSSQLATVTHAPGSEGQMWVVPAALKRDTQSRSNNNIFEYFPIGLEMACTAGWSLNCTASYDEGNVYRYDLIGRWTGGDNTSASSSVNEEFADNYWVDILEGGTLGSVYINPNSNSWEAGSSAYSIMGNCANDNWSVIFGGYVVGGTPGCADQTNIFPPTNGSPWLAIQNQTGNVAPAGTPTMSSSLSTGYFSSSWQFLKNGINNDPCVGIHTPNGIFGVSYGGCLANNTLSLNWDSGSNDWAWGYQGTAALRQFGPDYKGYLPGGVSGAAVFGQGFELGNLGEMATGQERLLDGGWTSPASSLAAQRLIGDVRLNLKPTPGGYGEWTNTRLTSNIYLTAAVTAGDLTIHLNFCPAAGTVPVGSPVIAESNIAPSSYFLLDQILGGFSSCSGGVLTLQSGAAYSSRTPDNNILISGWRPAGRIANDQAGTSVLPATSSYIANLMPCNSDSAVGLGVAWDGVDAATAGYNVPVGSVTGSTHRLVFCDGTSWTYH